MALKPCLSCGRLSAGSRCTGCTAARQQQRDTHRATQRPTRRTNREIQRRREIVAQHRATYGEQCPGWQRPPHQVTPPNTLSADHLVSVAAQVHAGIPVEIAEASELTVLCMRCNSAKAAYEIAETRRAN